MSNVEARTGGLGRLMQAALRQQQQQGLGLPEAELPVSAPMMELPELSSCLPLRPTWLDRRPERPESSLRQERIAPARRRDF